MLCLKIGDLLRLFHLTGERTELKNYRGISLLSVVGKINAGILVDRVRRVTGSLIDDEQGALKQGGGVD